MPLRCIILLLLTTYVVGCDQKPEQVYTRPVQSGKAYVLAAADHIAVVDLATTALSRIKMDKHALDLAIVNNGLYVLAADGTLATMKDETTLGAWQDGLSSAIAMTAAPDSKSLWLLADKTLQQFIPGQGMGKSISIEGSYSTFFFGESPEALWLINNQNSTATPLNLTTGKLGPEVTNIGNSVHQGLALAGTNELWLAEGNEFMNGQPYGVGFAPPGTSAMPGGINIIDLTSGLQNDFIMVGGNVVDLSANQAQETLYSATSQLPEYVEATLSLIDLKARRVTAELRLCQSCHQEQNIILEKGQGKVLALAVAMPEGDAQ